MHTDPMQTEPGRDSYFRPFGEDRFAAPNVYDYEWRPYEPLVDVGGTDRPWHHLNAGLKDVVRRFSVHVEVALETGKPLEQVRALPQGLPRHDAIQCFIHGNRLAHPTDPLAVPAAAPASIPDAQAVAALDALISDPSAASICCSSVPRKIGAFEKRVRQWLPLASFLAWGGLIVFVVHCYQKGWVH